MNWLFIGDHLQRRLQPPCLSCVDGRDCKLKADEKSECSLKETAATPPPIFSPLLPADDWTDTDRPDSKPGLSRVSVLLSPPRERRCLPVRASRNEAVSDFTRQPLSCIHKTNTHSVTSGWGKKPHWQAWTQTHTELIYACGEAVDEWTFSLFLIHCHFLVPLVCGCDCCYRVDLISLSHDRHEAQHTLRHAALCSAQVHFAHRPTSRVCVHASAFFQTRTSNIWILSILHTCLFQLSNL